MLQILLLTGYIFLLLTCYISYRMLNLEAGLKVWVMSGLGRQSTLRCPEFLTAETGCASPIPSHTLAHLVHQTRGTKRLKLCKGSRYHNTAHPGDNQVSQASWSQMRTWLYLTLPVYWYLNYGAQTPLMSSWAQKHSSRRPAHTFIPSELPKNSAA